MSRLADCSHGAPRLAGPVALCCLLALLALGTQWILAANAAPAGLAQTEPEQPEAAQELLTRAYQVEPNNFKETLEFTLRIASSPRSGGFAAGSAPKLPEDASERLQMFFAVLGLDFPGPEMNAPGAADPKRKSVLFNESSGQLFVRATREDLATIERLVRDLQLPRPNITIDRGDKFSVASGVFPGPYPAPISVPIFPTATPEPRKSRSLPEH